MEMPPRPQSHQFDPQSLVQIRRALGVSQAEMARTLGIPVNSVSRWEVGATVPSAASLAAVYSVAIDGGVAPRFFRRTPRQDGLSGTRTKLVVAWDHRNAPLESEDLLFWWRLMMEYLLYRFPEAGSLWLVRLFGELGGVLDYARLETEGFLVMRGSGDLRERLAAECRADCGLEPEATVLILVARDAAYADLVAGMVEQGVEVCVWAPEDADAHLVSAVDREHLVSWTEPYVIAAFLILIDGLEGRRITRARFAAECRKLVGEQPYFDPTAIGFRRRNPYGALLDWLVEHGFVDLRSDRDNPNFISVARRRSGVPQP